MRDQSSQSHTLSCGDKAARFAVDARLLRAMILLIFAILCLTVFGRIPLFSGLERNFGDLGDGRYNIIALEHWFRVVSGKAAWRDFPMFHPLPGVLGYSDTMLLLAPVYVAARLAGASILLADQLTMLSMPLVGFFGAYLFLRRWLAVSFFIAVILSAVFSLNCIGYYTIMNGHTQFIAAQWVPLILYFFAAFLARENGWGGVLYGCVAALLLQSVMISVYNVGWFVLFQGVLIVVLGGAYLMVSLGVGQGIWKSMQLVRARLVNIAAFLAVFLASGVPFFVLYIPVLQTFGVRDPGEILRLSPRIFDHFFARTNAIWQPVAVELLPAGSYGGPEMGKGVSWGVLVIFLATAVVVVRKRGNLHADSPAVALPLPLLLSASVMLSWVLMTKVDTAVLWTLAYQYVPGGGGVRTPFRYNLILIFSVIAVAGVGLDALWRRSRNIAGRAVILAVCLFLIAEQTCDTPSRQGREDYARLDAISSPPSSCVSFVIDPFSIVKGRRYTHRQLDAVLLSLRIGLPTLNGHSGHTPPGWALSDPENTPVYLEGLRAWADRFNLWDGLCAVDIERGVWRTISREEVISARSPARLP